MNLFAYFGKGGKSDCVGVVPPPVEVSATHLLGSCEPIFFCDQMMKLVYKKPRVNGANT